MESLIKKSEIYKKISLNRNDIEIWDDEYIENDWAYWNIVSNNSGVVKKITYLRIKDGLIQIRTYDEEGDDLWLVVK